MKVVVFVLSGALFGAPAAAQHAAEMARPPRTYSTSAIQAGDVAGWRADLRQLMREIERIHPDPFLKNPRAAFEAAIAALDARIPQLAAHEIIVELERVVAMVGDGHTNILLTANAGVDFHQLPIRLGLYADGFWVEAADRKYAPAVGGKLVAIGGVRSDSALARLIPIISRDNDQWFQVAAPNLLNLIEVLHALKLSDRLDRARFTIEKDGRQSDVVLEPLPDTRPRPFGYPFMPGYTSDWVDARDQAKLPVPLYQRRAEENYWWEYQPSQRLLYIKWDQVMNRPGAETALQTFRTAMAYARENAAHIDKVLIDIRNNTGGEGGLLDPIAREIVRTREVDEPGRLFVAIGPRTFSAGLLFTMQLARYTRAIFVGEPTGGKVNVAAGHEFVILPFSGVGVSVSPAFYQTGIPSDRREFVAPRLAVRPTFEDYKANRDPVLEAVLRYDSASVAINIEAELVRGDTAAAEKRVRDYDTLPLNRYMASAPAINALGYQFLRSHRMTEALRTFRLNVRVHPEYVNGWDSLGEAYEQAGQIAEAIAAFQEVLRREPNNGRAREILARLQRR
ncbi:MAG: tetratricopeptide repeat protein [Gemmatimonadota bacterium]